MTAIETGPIRLLIIDGTPNVGLYVELNPFGDATLDNTLTSATDTDVFAFAIDITGSTTIAVDDGGGALDPGLRLWDFEDDLIVNVELDTIGDDPQMTETLTLWDFYAAEVFAETSSFGDFTLTIDGPTASIATIAIARAARDAPGAFAFISDS